MNRIRSQFERLFSRAVHVPTEQTIMLKQISECYFLPKNSNFDKKECCNLLENRRNSFSQQQTLIILLGDVSIDQLQQNCHHRSVNCSTCKQTIDELQTAYSKTGIKMCVETAQKLKSLKRDIARETMDVESVLLEATKEDVVRLMQRSFVGLQEIFSNVTQLTIVFSNGIDEVIHNLINTFSKQITDLRIAVSAGCITENVLKAIASITSLKKLSFIVGHFQIDDLTLACCSQLKCLNIFCLCSNVDCSIFQLISALESKTDLKEIIFHQDNPIREQLQITEDLKARFIEYPTNTNETFQPCSKETCPQYFAESENLNQEKKELLKPYCYVLLPLLLITISIILLSIIRYFL